MQGNMRLPMGSKSTARAVYQCTINLDHEGGSSVFDFPYIVAFHLNVNVFVWHVLQVLTERD